MDYLRYRGGTPWTKEHDPYGNIELLDTALGVVAANTLKTAMLTNATAGAGAKIDLAEPTAGGTSVVTLQAPALTGNRVITMPDAAVNLGQIETNRTNIVALQALPVFVSANMADTMSREENSAGLASAILLANSLKTVMNAHAADTPGEHAAADGVNFPVATPNATNLATVLTLTGSLLTAYAAHNADAMLVGAWAFHIAQVNANALASAVAPVTLQEALARLNDLKAKYNAHQTSAVSHSTGNLHLEATANVAYGNTNRVPIAAVLGTDSIWIDLVDGGVGVVTLTTATMGAGFVDIQFSADPQNSAIVRYAIFRT